MTPSPTTILLVATLFATVSITNSSLNPPECASAANQNPDSLRRDKVTVVMNGFSESRIPLLQSLAATYSLSPIVSSILILWGNPSTSPGVLHQLAHNLSLSSTSAPISLLPQHSTSLNNRFLPRPNDITTDAVLICDDDVELDTSSFQFAFRVWQNNPNRLVGIFARSHDLDLNRKEWVYTVHPDRFSVVLTKFMILKSEYLFIYTCRGGTRMARARAVVDQVRNCEDLLMNFVVANETNLGPVLVGAKRVRDYGDARNEENGGLGLSVGLSSRKGEHRKRRGWCIREFHRVLGRMPLRYSYGKVVPSVGEQGLCNKADNGTGNQQANKSESPEEFGENPGRYSQFGQNPGKYSQFDSVLEKIYQHGKAQHRPGSVNGASSEMMRDREESYDTLFDGMDRKLKNAATYFEIDEEVDKDDYAFQWMSIFCLVQYMIQRI